MVKSRLQRLFWPFNFARGRRPPTVRAWSPASDIPDASP